MAAALWLNSVLVGASHWESAAPAAPLASTSPGELDSPTTEGLAATSTVPPPKFAASPEPRNRSLYPVASPAPVTESSPPVASFVWHPAALFPERPPLRETALIAAMATARVRQYGGQLTEHEMRAVLAEAGWPAELHAAALAVSWCESRWSPYAENRGNFGLFQANETDGATIRGPWRAYFGMPLELWSDPVSAALEARYIYEYARGWGPWACRP